MKGRLCKTPEYIEGVKTSGVKQAIPMEECSLTVIIKIYHLGQSK